jgi:hypothetical protein
VRLRSRPAPERACEAQLAQLKARVGQGGRAPDLPWSIGDAPPPTEPGGAAGGRQAELAEAAEPSGVFHGQVEDDGRQEHEADHGAGPELCMPVATMR